MNAGYHVVVSAGVSLGLQATLHSWPATLGCFLSGVLIDVDHYLEYWIIKKKFPFRFKDLQDFCDFSETKKTYLIFHGYEFLLILWFLIFFLQLNLVWLGVILGLTVHMIFDQFTNPIKPLFYFIIFRIRHNFEKSKILSESYYQRKSKV